MRTLRPRIFCDFSLVAQWSASSSSSPFRLPVNPPISTIVTHIRFLQSLTPIPLLQNSYVTIVLFHHQTSSCLKTPLFSVPIFGQCHRMCEAIKHRHAWQHVPVARRDNTVGCASLLLFLVLSEVPFYLLCIRTGGFSDILSVLTGVFPRSFYESLFEINTHIYKFNCIWNISVCINIKVIWPHPENATSRD